MEKRANAEAEARVKKSAEEAESLRNEVLRLEKLLGVTEANKKEYQEALASRQAALRAGKQHLVAF